MSTYIKLEDVQKILSSEIERLHWSSTLENILEKTTSLPSIDFEEMIKQEIEDCWKLSDSFNEKMVWTTREKLLQELISKLPK